MYQFSEIMNIENYVDVNKLKAILKTRLTSKIIRYLNIELYNQYKISLCSIRKIRQLLTFYEKIAYVKYFLKPILNLNLKEQTLLYSELLNDSERVCSYKGSPKNEKNSVLFLLYLFLIFYFQSPFAQKNILKNICLILQVFLKYRCTKHQFKPVIINYYNFMILKINRYRITVSFEPYSNVTIKCNPFNRNMSSKCLNYLPSSFSQERTVYWSPNHKNKTLKIIYNFLNKYAVTNYTLNRLNYNYAKGVIDGNNTMVYNEEVLQYLYDFRQFIYDNKFNNRTVFKIIFKWINYFFHNKGKSLTATKYIEELINHQYQFLITKFVSINKPGCFCYVKCVGASLKRRRHNFAHIYENSHFVLCKLCFKPLNIHSKGSGCSNYFMTNPNNRDIIYSCNHACSSFHIINSYEAYISDNGIINYHYKAIKKYNKYYTFLCKNNRLCYNLVINADLNVACKECKQISNLQNHESTCYDKTRKRTLHLLNKQKALPSRHTLVSQMCTGCIIYCFDFCRWYDIFNICVRMQFSNKNQ